MASEGSNLLTFRHFNIKNSFQFNKNMAKIINNKIKFEVIRFVDSIGNQVDVEFDAAPQNNLTLQLI